MSALRVIVGIAVVSLVAATTATVAGLVIPAAVHDAQGLPRTLSSAVTVFAWALLFATPSSIVAVPLALFLSRARRVRLETCVGAGAGFGLLPFAILGAGALWIGAFGDPAYEVGHNLLYLMPYALTGIVSGIASALVFWRMVLLRGS